MSEGGLARISGGIRSHSRTQARESLPQEPFGATGPDVLVFSRQARSARDPKFRIRSAKQCR